MEADSRAVVRSYDKRRMAEQWIKEGKQAVKMTRLSCHRFRPNEVRLWLSAIAPNLGHLWPGRPLGRVLPKKIDNWSLTGLRQRLVKTGGRLVKPARYYWLMPAESHLTKRLFGSMVRRIGALEAGRQKWWRRKKGGNGEMRERFFEMKYFHVFICPEEAALAPTWAAGVIRD
jgi:hypothetical protein